jgi:hypothetical protein
MAMLKYIHELPTAIQREGVTHASVGKTIIDNEMLHARVTYGTVTDAGEFEEDPLAGTHKLVVPDMELFLAAPSTITELPDTVGGLLQDSAAGLASYADTQNLWPKL